MNNVLNEIMMVFKRYVNVTSSYQKVTSYYGNIWVEEG